MEVTHMKKMSRCSICSGPVICCILVLFSLMCGCVDTDTAPATDTAEQEEGITPPVCIPPQSEADFQEDLPPIHASEVSITVLYDNNVYDPHLQPDWGFSCLIKGCEKTILFDTGANGSLLLKNMEKLQVTPEEIDIIVLSHIHQDHTGGLESILKIKGELTVYVLQSFPFALKEQIQGYGAHVIEVDHPVRVCSHVYTTGGIGAYISEQALIIRTDEGLVIITGCAHPGIVRIIQKAHDLLLSDIFMVMGGFHLQGATQSQIQEIIAQCQELGVQYAGPCHCSGDMAMVLFEQAYNTHYLSIGVGTVIYLSELE